MLDFESNNSDLSSLGPSYSEKKNISNFFAKRRHA